MTFTYNKFCLNAPETTARNAARPTEPALGIRKRAMTYIPGASSSRGQVECSQALSLIVAKLARRVAVCGGTGVVDGSVL